VNQLSGGIPEITADKFCSRKARLVKTLRKMCTGAVGAVIGVTSVIVIPLAAASPAGATPSSIPCLPDAGYAHCARYTYTGSDALFTVPAGVTSVHAKLWGAGGGGVEPAPGSENGGGGGGGFTVATLATTPRTTLSLTVGEQGHASGTTATFGGGGAAGTSGLSFFSGGSGGGMSAVFTSGNHATPLLIAGGGGGGGGTSDYPGNQNDPSTAPGGGGGGGLTGAATNGTVYFGGPGTQLAGGAADTALDTNCVSAAVAGSPYTGGTGGSATANMYQNSGGGGGGGGYFGGGGGACAYDDYQNQHYNVAGAGGGGSAYVAGAGVSGATTTAGASAVGIFTSAASGGSTDPLYDAGVGVGGGFQDGGNGEIVLEWNVSPAASVSAPSSMTIVSRTQTLPVTCKLTVRTLGHCRNSRGTYVIGTGSVTRTTGSAADQLTTQVTLNDVGHYLAGVAPIPTWVYASVTPYGTRLTLPATTRTVVQNANVK
jgi:hypothetical protein